MGLRLRLTAFVDANGRVGIAADARLGMSGHGDAPPAALGALRVALRERVSEVGLDMASNQLNCVISGAYGKGDLRAGKWAARRRARSESITDRRFDLGNAFANYRTGVPSS